MATLHGYAFNHRDFISMVRALVQDFSIPTSCSFVGAGEGEATIYCETAATTGTVTLTATAGGGDGVATFAVSGAMAGTLTSGTTNSLVQNGCTLRVRSTIDFVAGDVFTITLGGGGIGTAWTEIAFSDTAGVSGTERNWQVAAPGPGGADNIRISMETFTDALNSCYNVKLNGTAPLGAVSTDAFLYLQDNPMEFWISADDRNVTGVVVVGTVWESFNAGWADQLSSDVAQPFPMFVGAMGAQEDGKPSELDSQHSAFFDPGRFTFVGVNDGGSNYNMPDGSWRNLSNRNSFSTDETSSIIFPYQTAVQAVNLDKSGGTNTWSLVGPTINGALKTMETVITMDADKVPATLRNFRAVGGINSNAGDTINLSDGQYLIVQNGARTGTLNYGAIRLVAPINEATK